MQSGRHQCSGALQSGSDSVKSVLAAPPRAGRGEQADGSPTKEHRQDVTNSGKKTEADGCKACPWWGICVGTARGKDGWITGSGGQRPINERREVNIGRMSAGEAMDHRQTQKLFLT